MTTFRTVNGRTVISSDNQVRKDGFTDRERANEFSMGPHGGSDPTVAKATGTPEGAQRFMDEMGIGKELRSKNIPKDGLAAFPKGDSNSQATFKKAVNQDWRVKLSIPTIEPFSNAELLGPLRTTGGLVFPYTPTIIVAHSANYNTMAPTHTNYPYFAYQNSQVDQMNIIGEFPVQNSEDAKHWVATVNFLRTATKMFFGKDEGDGLKGNPPPIMHLSGYGKHMFDKVPVVVNSFNVELRSGIDYISTSGVVGRRSDASTNYNGDDSTWAPTLSNISVLVTPVCSRDTVKRFSLKEFARGTLGTREGIGFI